MKIKNNDTPMEFFRKSLPGKTAEFCKSAALRCSIPASRMARILLEERQLARAQMADKLRAFVRINGPLRKSGVLAYIKRLEEEE